MIKQWLLDKVSCTEVPNFEQEYKQLLDYQTVAFTADGIQYNFTREYIIKKSFNGSFIGRFSHSVEKALLSLMREINLSKAAPCVVVQSILMLMHATPILAALLRGQYAIAEAGRA
jgi:hypothetical protein